MHNEIHSSLITLVAQSIEKWRLSKIILYADDLVLFSSCCAGLQQKTDVDFDIRFNAKKNMEG